MKDPDKETMTNRKAAMEMARKQAINGDSICGGMFALESIAHASGLGFVATTQQDFRDEDEDDEMRPF